MSYEPEMAIEFIDVYSRDSMLLDLELGAYYVNREDLKKIFNLNSYIAL